MNRVIVRLTLLLSFLTGICWGQINTGTAVGDFGTILRTTNGGATWVIQSSGTTNGLLGLSFTDANTGTAVGAGGIIRRTTNGGATWVSQTSGTTIMRCDGESRSHSKVTATQCSKHKTEEKQCEY
ncbi:MAG: hypothetical protein AAB393_04640 [Bacteroidota bacterium]